MSTYLRSCLSIFSFLVFIFFPKFVMSQEACWISQAEERGYPAVCVPDYIKAGAFPGDRQCIINCITMPSNLGNFFCPNKCYEYCGALPCEDEDIDEDKNRGCGGKDGGSEGNPCRPATGNKFQVERDYASANGYLTFTRYYNSLSAEDHGVGVGWSSTLARKLDMLNSTELKIRESNGRAETWKKSGGNWVGDPDSKLRLSENAGRYVLAYGDGATDVYSADGALLSESDAYGLTTVYHYDANGKLARVEDPFGRSMSLEHDNTGRLSSITDPAGGKYDYAYDNLGNLISVRYPDMSTRTYLYENTGLPHALTGIINENNVRFATWSYNSDGYVVLSEHAGGADKITLTYNDNKSTTVQNALGASRTYFFENSHGVKRITKIDGDRCSNCPQSKAKNRSYDENGFLASTTDWVGNTTQLVHDDFGREISRIDASSSSESFTTTTEWHDSFRLPKRVTEPGRTTEWEYDAKGAMLQETMIDISGVCANSADRAACSRTTSYSYYPNGLLHTIDGPRTDIADIKTYEYDSLGNRVLIRNELGQEYVVSQHDAHGNPTLVKDSNGVETEYDYDARQRLIAITIAGKSGETFKTEFSYDKAGNLLYVTEAGKVYLKYAYDDANRLVRIEDNYGNYISNTLDAMGNILQQDVHDAAGVLSATQASVFNVVSELIESKDARGESQSWTYDLNGNVVAAVDAKNQASQLSYDALNRLKQQTNPIDGKTSFSYNARDNITEVIDARGLKTIYQYNGFDEVIQQNSPDTGITTFDYDAAGNRIRSTDARGVVSQYRYDALNRITAMHYPSASAEDVEYTYDDTGNDNYGRGRLANIKDASGETAYRYDYLGNIVSRTSALGTKSYRFTYTYDAGNRLQSVQYPSGRIVHYRYDKLSRIAGIDTQKDVSAKKQRVITNVRYLPFGPVSGFKYGNGINQNYIYDLDYRLTGLSSIGNQTLMQRSYGYDANNNILGIENPMQSLMNQVFGYDKLDRLIEAEGLYGKVQYAYDSVGNRNSRSLENSGQVRNETYVYASDSNQLVSLMLDADGQTKVRDFNYDTSGNVIKDTLDGKQNNVTINNANRPATWKQGSTTLTYVHNALGQRTAKRKGAKAEYYLYSDSGQLLSVLNTNGVAIQEYIYFEDQVVGIATARGLYYALNDHLATTQRITNKKQKVLWEISSQTPFGQTVVDDDPDGDGKRFTYNLRFPGQYWDVETQTSYNYYRTYDPSLGRYVQSDPIGLDGGINTYAYVHNNPLKYTDPLGLAVQLCKQPAFGIPWNPIDHHWIKTDTAESGMGPAKSDCGNAGNQSGDLPGDPVQTCDHSQRDMTGASCETLDNVNEDIVNDLIKPGRPLGRWLPWNQCQSFARDVINDARTGCRQTRRGVRCPGVF